MEGDPLLDRWDAVDTIFSAALELPEGEREAYLRQSCREDGPLLELALSLLAAHHRADDFLEVSGRRAREILLHEFGDEGEAAAPLAGTQRVGPYRLVREIGRGGTGAVYLAERDDGAFRQAVAVKLLRRGLDTDDILARFRAERQILASLNHPNIARLVDGGARDDGRPYLVMELVEGRPITEYCDAHRLTVDERLRLFLAVGRTVQYAHQNLVVHRDLKPGNILVTEPVPARAGAPSPLALAGAGAKAGGQVKLLDFGIAKLLDESVFPGTTPRTRTGVRPMTPEYASPEQVQGAPVGIGSDIYQLGILLYELLAGRRPYELKRYSPGEAERVILTREPLPPSSTLAIRTRTTDAPAPASRAAEAAHARSSDVRRLCGRLRGDLDTIVLKALRKEPERRYPTVAALLDDLERHLAGRPVKARPDTWHYRAHKLARRRPGAVAAAIVLLLAAGGYTLTLRAHAVRLEQERNLARAEREQADQARRLARDEQRRATSERDRAEAERERAEAAQLAAERERDRAEAERTRAEQALVRARLEAEKTEQVAGFLVGLFEASNPSAERTDTITARALLARGTERIRQQLDRQPEVRAALLSAIGRIHTRLGLFDQAQPLLEESLALRRQLHGPAHPEVAEGLELLAANYADNRGFPRAEAPYREALAIRRRQPDVAPLTLAGTLAGLARTLGELGRPDSAEVLIRETLTLRRGVLGDTHPEVIGTLARLASILREKNDLDGAESLYREALAAQRADASTNPLALAATQNDLAYLLSLRSEYAAAEALYREALATYRAILGEAHRSTAVTTTNLVGVLFDQGEMAEAEALLRERVEVERRHQPPNHWRIGGAVGGLAAFFSEQGDHARAEPLLREEIAIYTAGLGANHGWTVSAQAKLGHCLTSQQRFPEAEEVLLAALAVLHGAEETASRTAARAEVQAALVQLYEAWGRPERATPYRTAAG